MPKNFQRDYKNLNNYKALKDKSPILREKPGYDEFIRRQLLAQKLKFEKKMLLENPHAFNKALSIIFKFINIFCLNFTQIYILTHNNIKIL